MIKVTDDIYYIGVDDLDIDLFEGQYPVPEGVSYNSYVCIDKKIAVFDTVDISKTGEWLKNLELVLKGRQPDYLIISHMEPDHAASIPAFLQKHPSATVVGNDKTFIIFKRFFRNLEVKTLTVKDGDTLDLGRHKIAFLLTPMVHWPEVMMSYDETDKVFFSADAFGKFGALSSGGEWTDEARRYFINIVGKYGAPVQAVLKKAAALDIKIICPLHGPVLSGNLDYYLSKYDIWSSYRPEEDGVTIAYASIYGNTAKTAKTLADKLSSGGVKCDVYDLARCDAAQAVASAFRYSKLVIAAVTLDANLMPCVENFIYKLKTKNFNNRTVGFIENGSWAPYSARLMRTALEGCKNLNFCNTAVTINSAIDGEAEKQLASLCDELTK